MLKNILLVGLGGFAGSIGRYLVYAWIEKGKSLPFATLTVNLIGSLILGMFIGYYLSRGSEPNNLRLLIAVGFCGSFTTFSTLAFELWDMLADNHVQQVIFYLLTSLILGIFLIFAGIEIGKML